MGKAEKQKINRLKKADALVWHKENFRRKIEELEDDRQYTYSEAIGSTSMSGADWKEYFGVKPAQCSKTMEEIIKKHSPEILSKLNSKEFERFISFMDYLRYEFDKKSDDELIELRFRGEELGFPFLFVKDCVREFAVLYAGCQVFEYAFSSKIKITTILKPN